MLRAVAEIRRMRGGSQPHLMRAEDGHYYVVKFQNNPQGSKILANELLGCRLASLLGLPVARGEMIFVDDEMVRLSDDLVIQLKNERRPCQGGLCFGSRLPIDPLRGTITDFIPDEILARVLNLDDFCGMLAFDVWVCNTDGRQVVCHRKSRTSYYRATMIDQGFCFGAEKWSFPDSPLRGIYHRRKVYERVRDISAFEPWLRRLEKLEPHVLREEARTIPPEWYGDDQMGLERLLSQLNQRRMRVRAMLNSVLRALPDVFPSVGPGREPVVTTTMSSADVASGGCQQGQAISRSAGQAAAPTT
jgi:hypothetical protein